MVSRYLAGVWIGVVLLALPGLAAECVVTPNPPLMRVPAAGGVFVFTAAAPDDCFYNAISITREWLAPTAGEILLQGTRQVMVTVAPNPATLRRGYIQLAGGLFTVQFFVVVQEGVTTDPGGDLDRNGNADAIWQDPVSGTTQAWLLGGGSGTALLGARNISNANPWRFAGLADMNGDGIADLLWQDPVTGSSQAWLLNQQGQMAGIHLPSMLTMPNQWRIVCAPSALRLVWQSPDLASVQVWDLYMASGLWWPGAQSVTLPAAMPVVACGDFDRDGLLDVVVQNPATGESAIWFVTDFNPYRALAVTRAAALSGANPWRIRVARDFDRDGTPDLLWQDPVTGAAQIWFQTGPEGNQLRNAITLNGANPWRIQGPR